MPVRIESIAHCHEASFIEAALRSREFHQGWVAPPTTSEAFAAYLDKYSSDRNEGYVAMSDNEALVGCINLNEIVRGGFLSAYLGYFAFVPYQRRGLMKAALRAVVSTAFGPLGLHRLEANIQPNNMASIKLVQSLGFRLEGFSSNYLKIAGAWRDHERYALTAEEWLS